MLLSEIYDSVCIDNADDYHIKVEPGPYLLIRVPMIATDSKSQFDHANLLARFYRLLEFKHYRRNGNKFWTNKPGTELFFAVPKDRIKLIEKKTHSYPMVEIGGEVITLSTSAGSNGGTWTDYISRSPSTHVNIKKRQLIAIANAAMSIGEAKCHGITLKPHRYSFDTDESVAQRHEEIKELVTKAIVGPQLDQGWRVMLSEQYKIGGKHGVFVVQSPRRKRSKSVRVGSSCWACKVNYKHIDWLKTAELNNVELPGLVDVNRVPPTNS